MTTKTKNRQPVSPSVDPAVSPSVDPAVQPDPLGSGIDQQTAEHLAGLLTGAMTPTAPAVDPADTFRQLFVRLAGQTADLTDTDQTGLADAYRAIHGAVRGTVQSDAMADAMRHRCDPDRTLALVDYLRTITTTRTRTAAPVDPVDVYVDRLAGLTLAGLLVERGDADADRVHTGLAGLFGQSNADLLVNLLAGLTSMGPVDPIPTDRHADLLTRATRAAGAVTRGQSGPRGPVQQRRAPGIVSAGRAHVDHCMANVAVGTFLSTGAMAKLVSPAYPGADRRPSAGALANVVRTDTGPVVTDTWTGQATPDGATRTA